jgi:fatty acid desaturase
MSSHIDFHALLHRFEERLPEWIKRNSRWLRQPSARKWRMPAAGLLIFGGFLGFLPVLGFWMVPLGLVLLAVDLPALQPPLARLLHWIERKWPHAPQEPK